MSIEIIAEASLAYEGVLERALLLARAACGAGADAVKFQIVFADELATPDYEYYSTYARCEMAEVEWRRLVEAVHDVGLRCYVDIFGPRSLSLARRVAVDGVKLHSASITHQTLIRNAAALFDRFYIHCGGAEENEIQDAVTASLAAGRAPCLLHGFQAHPTPLQENHLRRLPILRERFPGCRIGFMDHTDGTHFLEGRLGLVALGLGVDCIEKHLTLDRSLKLIDHISALDPRQFGVFCAEIRAAEIALGTASLELTPAEQLYATAFRRRVVAAEDLAAGTCLRPEHLMMKRIKNMEARDGLIERMETIVGRTLARGVKGNAPITWDDMKTSL